MSVNRNDQCYASQLPSEVVTQILQHVLDSPEYTASQLLQCALTCKAWSYTALQLLWHRPIIAKPQTWLRFSKSLALSDSYIHYSSLVRRINLATIPEFISDDSLIALSDCKYLDRLTLAGCSHITNDGLVHFLNQDVGHFLQSIDLSEMKQVTDDTILTIARTCKNLHGLNLSVTTAKEEELNSITDKSILAIAENCKELRKIRLANWSSLTDKSISALVTQCPSLLEIDVSCNITNSTLVQVFQQCRELRELKLNNCPMLNDLGFLDSSLSTQSYDQLRILELSNNMQITDRALDVLTRAAPKLRNLVLNKCVQITDQGVEYISRLGRSLHHLHLGGCREISDLAVIQLSSKCVRLRYIDLSNCHRLGNDTVVALATLPKLKRIGLVKCHQITDRGILAFTLHARTSVSLERLHLSYCDQLTELSIPALVIHCKRLTHLSLSFIPAFQQEVFRYFCKTPPKEFNAEARNFCVFSGQSILDLRNYLKSHRRLEAAKNRVPQRENTTNPVARQLVNF